MEKESGVVMEKESGVVMEKESGGGEREWGVEK